MVNPPRIDRVAQDTATAGQRSSHGSHKGRLLCRNRMDSDGWVQLAAAVLAQGCKKALGQRVESGNAADTVDYARRFVLSDWGQYLALLARLDEDVFVEQRAAWAEAWAAEEGEVPQPASHDALPDSLLPDWYKRGVR